MLTDLRVPRLKLTPDQNPAYILFHASLHLSQPVMTTSSRTFYETRATTAKAIAAKLILNGDAGDAPLPGTYDCGDDPLPVLAAV